MKEVTESRKKRLKIIVGIAAFLCLIGAIAIIYFKFRDKPVHGSKKFTIEVMDNNMQKVSYEVQSDAEYLRQAMEETEGLTFSGTESEYGMMLETVNGLRADYSIDKAYWALYVNGAYGVNGIDTQPVKNGEIYSIYYTIGE